jgi:DNA polymerase III delta prime subunit
MVNIWVEKYKPQSSKDFPFYKKEIQTIKKWLRCFINNKINMYNFKNALLISGPSGIGKTTLINIILKELNIAMLEFNASSDDTPVQIIGKLNQVFSTKNIMSFISTKNMTCVVVDELDVINSRKEFSSSHLVDFFEFEKKKFYAKKKTKKSKQSFIPNKTPIICITNKSYIKHLKGHTIHLKLPAPSIYRLKTLSQEVINKESFDMDDDILQLIISKTQGDYRRLLIMLEDVCNFIKIKNITNKSIILKKINSLSQKDDTGTMYEYANDIFSTNQNVLSILNKYNTFSKPLIFLIHDNFINYINTNCKYNYKQKIKFCKKYYKNFVDGNVFLNKSFGNWHLNNYGAILSLKSANNIIPKIKKTTTNSFLNSSVILSKYNYRYYNLKYINNFSKK